MERKTLFKIVVAVFVVAVWGEYQGWWDLIPA